MSSKLTNSKTVTIANGASLSDAVDMLGMDFLGFRMPAAWTAAVITFSASEDGTTYGDLFNSDGTEKTFTVQAGQFVVVALTSFFNGVRYFKMRSGTAAVPVNQGAERIITIVRRPF